MQRSHRNKGKKEQKMMESHADETKCLQPVIQATFLVPSWPHSQYLGFQKPIINLPIMNLPLALIWLQKASTLETSARRINEQPAVANIIEKNLPDQSPGAAD